MNLPSCLCLPVALALALASCSVRRPGVVDLPTVGFVSQETIAHACRQRTVRRRGTSGFECVPDGRQSYLARLAMVEAAQRTLDVQYFIWSDDVVGTVFADRLLAAADRGVRVRLLLDMTRGAQREVASAALAAHPNIQVGFFNPMTAMKGIFVGNPIPLLGEIDRMQSRMHNKLIVADGAVVMGGGRNLGDTYFGVDRHRNHRDLDYIAVGPVVENAARAFDLYWKSPLTQVDDQEKVTTKERGKLEDLRRRIGKKKRSLAKQSRCPYPTALTRVDALDILQQMTQRMLWAEYQFVADPPERMLRMGRVASPVCHSVEEALANAKSEIIIHNAYFVPQQGMLDLLSAAAARGVQVRVLTNSLASIDSPAASAGLANRRSQVLDTGASLYELNARAPSRKHYVHSQHMTLLGMHTKGLVVDGRVSFIGSYNLDPRSKFINTETGVIIQDERFAARLKSYLLEDLQPTHAWHVRRDSKGVIYWAGRSGTGRLIQHRYEPDAALGRRLVYWFYRCLPWEDML